MEIDRFHTILYHWHVVGKRVTPFYSKIVQSILWFESFPRAMRKAFKIYTILLTVPQVFPRRKPCSMKPRWNCYCDSSFNERVSGFDHQIIFSLGPLEAAIELNQSMSPNHSLGRQQRRRLCNYEFSSIRVMTSLPQQTRKPHIPTFSHNTKCRPKLLETARNYIFKRMAIRSFAAVLSRLVDFF